MPRLLCLFFFGLALIEQGLSSSANCDNFKRKNGRIYRRIVRCSHGNLTVVPQLSRRNSPVSELLLDDNRLSRLSDQSFHSWGSLERLSVRNNRISRISVRAFRPLRKLRRLNLSGNRLHLPSGLSVFALAYVPEIVELDLSFNPLRRIPTFHFQILGSLQILHLRGVARPDLIIEDDAFARLKVLHTLDLTSNYLQTMPKAVLGDIYGSRRLSTLLLGGTNPWRCDCRIRWLKIRQMRQLPVPLRRITSADALVAALRPQCAEPPVLMGRDLFSVDDLSPADFQCPPVLRSPQGPVRKSAYAGQNISFSCSISADPLEGVEWFKDGQVVSLTSVARPFVKTRSEGPEAEARLLLPWAQASDTGVWRCMGWNRRGRASRDFHLSVQAPCSPAAERPIRVLGFIVMLAWGLLFLALAGLGMCYIRVRRKRCSHRLARLARRTLIKEERPSSNVYLEKM